MVICHNYVSLPEGTMYTRVTCCNPIDRMYNPIEIASCNQSIGVRLSRVYEGYIQLIRL